MPKLNEEQLEAEIAANLKLKEAIKKLDDRIMRGPSKPLTDKQKEETKKVVEERKEFFKSKPVKSKESRKVTLNLMLKLAIILYGVEDPDVKEMKEAISLIP